MDFQDASRTQKRHTIKLYTIYGMNLSADYERKGKRTRRVV